MAFHHVAYSTKDLEATRHFYEDLFGFPLVNTEFHDREDGWIKHVFFDTGNGQCIAFFAFENIGETADWATAKRLRSSSLGNRTCKQARRTKRLCGD